MDSNAMITATAWVPRGFAAQFPTRKEFSEKEFERIAGIAKLRLDTAVEELEEAGNKEGDDDEMDIEEDNGKNWKEIEKNGNLPTTASAATPHETTKGHKDDDNDLKQYNLDAYDDTDGSEGEGMGMFKHMKSLAYHENGEEDPYITLKDEDDLEEKEELQILSTDNLLLVAKSEDDLAQLEIYVYEDSEDNLYIHHDVMLPAIPLCIEWLDIPVSPDSSTSISKDSRGNFVAIGTMDPDIEIWDLDIIDSMYPNAILGPSVHQDPSPETKKDKKSKKKKKKRNSSAKPNDDYHVDSVLALSANRSHRNLLASGSADKTIKLWDLNTVKCAKSYNTFHTDKVCALSWHLVEPTILLSGSYDRTVVAADMRAPDSKPHRWGVEADVEAVRWDPHDHNRFYISTEGGMLYLHDVRNAPSSPQKTKPIWTLQAHDKALSAFDVNPIIPGFLVTGSFDKTVKIWDVAPGSSGPSMVVSRDLGVGKVFSANFAPDKEVGFRLAVAGSRGVVQVWDTSTNKAVRNSFAHRVVGDMKMPDGDVTERLVGVQESEDEGSSDGEEVQKGAVVEHEENDDEENDSEERGDGWESMDEDG